MSAEQNKTIARRFFEEQDARRGPLAPELVAPNYTAYIGSNPPMGIEGHSQFGLAFYSAFPDLYHTMDAVVGEGDDVAVRFTLRGTHKGNFYGAPPTENKIRVTANILLHFNEGKVSELYGEFDSRGLFQQIAPAQT